MSDIVSVFDVGLYGCVCVLGAVPAVGTLLEYCS